MGDRVLSSAGSAFDVAGATPLKMPVVGVLQPTGTADDQAVFVDVKTTWVIAGLAHGHDDVVSTQPADPSPSTQEQRSVVAQASVLPYTEITSTNRHSFHFHGEPDLFPIDAIVVVPTDYKSGILLRGRYEESHQNVQMVVPSRVVAEILDTMFSVRDYVLLGSVGVAAATFLTVALVFGLSIRLRRREIETIQKIGGSSRHLAGILSLEILLVVLTGGFVASMLTLCVSQFGDILIHLVSR